MEAGSAHDRAVGALLGLAAGDAVGTTLEFRAPGTFEPIDDMVGGGPFGLKAGQWTDDTSMALCLAESLLDRGGMDTADQMRRYLMWRSDGYLGSTGTCFDIGSATSSQLSRFEQTGEVLDLDPDEEQAANGSLMRLAPVPIRWHQDPAEAAQMAAESSRPTHPAARPVDACRLLAAMTSALISGTPADEVLAPGFWQWGDLHPEIAAIAAGSWREKEPPTIRGTGFCVHALEAALWAVAGASDFREAVLRAANLGDDADTTAAIAGQLAGARWGATGIPKDWTDKLALAERIIELATGLFRAGGGHAPTARWAHDDLVHAWWVEPGSLLAGEYPGHADDEWRVGHKVNLLIDAGVRTFVDLTEEGELEPYEPQVRAAAEARRLDVRHHRRPIPDFGVIHDAGYHDILRLIDDEQGRGAVYVHCWGGHGRTGTVVGCRLAAKGHGYDDIISRIGDLRAGTRKAHTGCPESPDQHDLLRRLAAR